jgi:hypothetical protein
MKVPKTEQMMSWAGKLLWWGEVLVIPTFLVSIFTRRS